MRGELTPLSDTRWKYKTGIRTYYVKRRGNIYAVEWDEKGTERAASIEADTVEDVVSSLDDGPPSSRHAVLSSALATPSVFPGGAKYSYAPPPPGTLPATNPVPLGGTGTHPIGYNAPALPWAVWVARHMCIDAAGLPVYFHEYTASQSGWAEGINYPLTQPPTYTHVPFIPGDTIYYANWNPLPVMTADIPTMKSLLGIP